MRIRKRIGLAGVSAACLALAACWGGTIHESYVSASEGAPARGRAVIVRKGCGACHTIPGIRSASGLVGPPLTGFGRRTYIAGELPNNEANLVRWLQAPQSVEPKTAMPNLGLTPAEASDAAAYLLSLQSTEWMSR
jgi:cytochrome c1